MDADTGSKASWKTQYEAYEPMQAKICQIIRSYDEEAP
jgi:hypothetical protein